VLVANFEVNVVRTGSSETWVECWTSYCKV